MERVKLYCGEERRGEVSLQPEGSRIRIRAAMTDPGDGLYRAALSGPGGQTLLGVMEPAGGELAVCRRLYARDIDALGTPLRGEAWRSFRFQDTGWQEAGCPARMFQDRFLQSRLQSVGRSWQRKERGLLLLALPLEEGKPFPLEALFCLARIERVEGHRCAVYAFKEEEPVLPPHWYLGK